MSDKKEKETGKVRNISSKGLRLSSNTNAGISGSLTRVASKTSSADKSKRTEESSAASKRTTKGLAVYENQPGKLSTVFGSVWRPRASAVVLPESAAKSSSVSSAVKLKRTAADVAQKETRAGRKEVTQVPQTPTGGKHPVSPATKTLTKTATSQQAWKKKAQPESSTKEVTVKSRQARPSGSTSKKSTATTEPGPSTDSSKLKKSSAQKQVLEEDCLPKDQSSGDKQVQGKQAKHKAFTSKSNLDTVIYHIRFDVTELEEPDNEIVGVCCCLCEQDLGVAPLESNTETEYSTLPVAAILTCGHTFHNDCLACGELEGQQTEPLCVFCESL